VVGIPEAVEPLAVAGGSGLPEFQDLVVEAAYREPEIFYSSLFLH
jgi:hypothetical protein